MDENKIEQPLIPRDISAEYERIMTGEYRMVVWRDFYGQGANGFASGVDWEEAI